jgi:hypothetical protein
VFIKSADSSIRAATAFKLNETKFTVNAPPGVNSAYTQATTTGVPAGAYPSSIQTSMCYPENDLFFRHQHYFNIHIYLEDGVYSNSSSNSGYQGASSQTAYGS